jgi:hypothetical protein|tara:strand:+ start:1833 stop:3029 length:1197 start_codon:yes stop_codon:yes gene_type:complete
MKISSLNLSKVNKAVTGITETVRKSKSLIDDISEKVGKTNERIKTKISDSAKLFQRRQQAVRRKVREDLIEASGIGGAMRRVNKIVSTSTRGFLGRILDFVGTILVGWAIVNIPKIVKLAENLFKRLEKFFKIITGFTDSLVEYFTKFTSGLSEIGSNLSQIDLQIIGDQMTNIVTRLQKSFKRMEDGFIREVLGFSKMSDEDLIKSFGQDVDEVTKEEVESNVKEQIPEDIFENLPENIQEAIKLKMSLEDDLKLDEIDLETVQSGDIEEIKKMLEESNIIGKKDETGKIKYEKRVQNNDLLEDANNIFKSINEAFREFDGTPGSRETLDSSVIENNIKKRDLTKVERNEKIIITNNNQKVNTIQKGKSKEEKITLNTDSVNNNNFLRDLNLQKIKE